MKRWFYPEPCQRSKIERFGKTIIADDYPKITVISVKCVGMQLWKRSEYFKTPNMPGFSTCKCYKRFGIWLNNT